MAQTREGAQKIAAAKAGLPLAEYLRLQSEGLKWCTGCKSWQTVDKFGQDSSRWDGLAAQCLSYRRRIGKERYQPKVRNWSPGRSFVPARDGDQKQARRRVNYFVEVGILKRPDDLPCVDCGHHWKPGERRHEYDHYLGYDAAHHEDVEPVCTTCHNEREARRRADKD